MEQKENRTHFSLHYCCKATRLNNWWKTCASCFPLSLAAPHALVNSSSSNWAAFGWCLLHLGEVINWQHHTRCISMTAALSWQLWRREKRSKEAADNLCGRATKQRNLVKSYCKSSLIRVTAQGGSNTGKHLSTPSLYTTTASEGTGPSYIPGKRGSILFADGRAVPFSIIHLWSTSEMLMNSSLQAKQTAGMAWSSTDTS